VNHTHLCKRPYIAALLGGAAFFMGSTAWAASCCGGGSSASLVLPKFSKAMLDISMDVEQYDGYWNKSGKVVSDPPGSDLNQYRLNIGYAHRIASRWQASMTLPYVWNDNQYAGEISRTEGFGDASINVWYEAFDAIKCVWKVRNLNDLKPATYIGASLTVPTGVSPYDDVKNSFDVTGRGMYRLDGMLSFDKTIYPWNAAAQLVYGKYLQRPVNREYGDFKEPYDKRLGDRSVVSLSGGYTFFLESMDTVTLTMAYADLREQEGEINGSPNPITGMHKSSISNTVAFSTMDRDWVIKFTWSHALAYKNGGENFPITDVYTVGVSHVFR